MDKDKIYFTIQKGKFYDYRLFFIIGGSTQIFNVSDLDTTDKLIRIPANVLTAKINLSAKYDNDQPWGLPLTDEIDLEFGISNYWTGVDGEDMSDLRQWIMDGTGDKSAEACFNTVWIQKGQFNSETNQFNVVRTSFIGCQEVKPEKKIDSDNSQAKFSITFLSVFRYIFENTEWSEMPTGYDYHDYQIDITKDKDSYLIPGLIDRQWILLSTVKPRSNEDLTGTYILPTFGFAYEKGTIVNCIYLSTFINALETLFRTKLRKITRVSDIGFDFQNNFMSHIKLYKQTTALRAYGAYVFDEHEYNDEIYLIWEAYLKTDKTNVRFGLNSTNDKNQTLYHYKTPWDFFAGVTDGYISKGYFAYSTTNNYLIFKKVLESTLSSQSFTEIKKQHITGNITITKGQNVIQTATCQLHGVTGDYYTNDEQIQRGGAENDKKFAGFIPFHNVMINHSETDIIKEEQFNYYLIYKGLPIVTGMYYKDYVNGVLSYKNITPTIRDENLLHDDFQALRLMGDACKLYLNDTLNYSTVKEHDRPTATYNNGILNQKNGEYYQNLIKWMQGNHDTGLPYVINQSAIALMGNPNQCYVELTIKSNNIDFSNLGCKYKLDISAILPERIDINVNTTDAYLISVETDLITEESKCKFFLNDVGII